MSARLLKHFHTPARCYAVALAHGKPDMLGILCLQSLEGAPEPRASLLSLILFNLQSQTTEAVVTYNGMGPDLLQSLATDALLAYDPLTQRWAIAQLQREWYLGMRTLTKQGDTYLLSPLCLLDSGEGERGMNPLLDLECQRDIYRVVYHRDVPGHTRAGEVRNVNLSLRPAEWETLQVQAVVISTGGDVMPPHYTWQEWNHDVSIPPLEVSYLEPEGVVFDPGTSSVHQTGAANIQGPKTIAESENAMVYRIPDFQVLALFCPEGWVRPRPSGLQPRPPQHGAWRVWLTGWDSNWTNLQWAYMPEISVPSDASLPPWEYPSWPDADIALTPGPPAQQQATLVMVLTLQPLNGETVRSQGVCLDTTGRVIQRCQDRFGRLPHLACGRDMVVGVDYQESGWRLWNWPVHQSMHLQNTLALDVLCQRSYVHAEEASSWFWLVEEIPSGVRVSRRDTASLAEVADAVWLPDVKLLETQTELRPLNGYHDKGVVPLNGELLLLVEDQKGELLLYQV